MKKIIEKLERRKTIKKVKKICKQNKHDCWKCEYAVNTLDYVGCAYNLK